MRLIDEISWQIRLTLHLMAYLIPHDLTAIGCIQPDNQLAYNLGHGKSPLPLLLGYRVHISSAEILPQLLCECTTHTVLDTNIKNFNFYTCQIWCVKLVLAIPLLFSGPFDSVFGEVQSRRPHGGGGGGLQAMDAG